MASAYPPIYSGLNCGSGDMSYTAVRILAFILIFGMVFLISETLLRQWRQRGASAQAINRRLQMIEKGSGREEIIAQIRKVQNPFLSNLPGPLGRMLNWMGRIVQASGIRTNARQVIAMLFAAVAAIFLTIVLGAGAAGYGVTLGMIQLALVLSVCLGLVMPLLFLSQRAQKKRAKMQEQFPVALDIFVRGLRAGHPISAALGLLAAEMEDPIGSEFGVITDEVAYGADLRMALQDMANRWDMNDLHMFVVSLSVQNETGGNLAEILENLARVIRERSTMLMKVRALSSEGRMSAKILTGLPIGTFVIVFLMNPAFYLEYSSDPAFIIGFSGLIGLYLLGVLIIRKMVDLKV